MPHCSTVWSNDARHGNENIPVDLKGAPHSNKNTDLSSPSIHGASNIHRSHRTRVNAIPKAQSHTHCYRSVNSERSLRRHRILHQIANSTGKQVTADPNEEDAQRLLVLSGLSNITLRELVTDCVLELLRSHLHQTDVRRIGKNKPNPINKPNIEIDHYQQPLTPRRVQHTTSHKRPNAIPQTSSIKYTSFGDTLRVPVPQLESDHLPIKKTATKTQSLFDGTNRPFSSETMKTKEQDQPVPHTKFSLSSHPKGYVDSSAGSVADPATKMAGADRAAQYSSLSVSRYQKRSPMLFNASEQRLMGKALPVTPESSTGPLQSSLRSSKSYSANGTLKRIRFKRQGTVFSDVSNRSASQSVLASPSDKPPSHQ